LCTEHAYYLRHQHRRADYIETRWNVADWQRVAARYPSTIGDLSSKRPSASRREPSAAAARRDVLGELPLERLPIVSRGIRRLDSRRSSRRSR
jgi:hypothetical protein